MKDPVTFAVAQCPFLSKVAAQNGPEYARSIAINPTATVGWAEGEDSIKQYEASFQLFHGPSGIVPLVQAAERQEPPAARVCPFHALHSAAEAQSETTPHCVTSSKPLARTLPLATISLSSGPGSFFGDFLRNKLHNKQHTSKRPPSQRQPPSTGSNGHISNSSSHQPTQSSSAGHSSGFKPQRPLTDPSSSGGGPGSTGAKATGGANAGAPGYGHGPQPPSASSAAANSITGSYTAGTSTGGLSSTGSSAGPFHGFSSSSGINGPGSGPSPFKGFASSSNNMRSPGSAGGPARGPRTPGANSSRSMTSGSSAAAPAPQCPLRKWLGPMAGLVFNEYDKLVCPPPIVAARAALAKTAAVQQLRPQKLPVKLVAVAAVSAAANLPCGAVREHFEKFSLGWFIAVHATIPFVAMLRKAVLMPKYSIMVTIASAVLGQMIGSRLERVRLQQQQMASSAVEPGLLLTAAAPTDSKTAIRCNSSRNKSGGSAVVRDTAWKQRLFAGGRAELGDFELPGGAAAAAGGCAVDAAEGSAVFNASVGLGSWLPQLPVVKA